MQRLGSDSLSTVYSKTENALAYAEPRNHPSTRRLRDQAWLVMVIMQDSGMRPDELFSTTIEYIRWEEHRVWIPDVKTKKLGAL